MKIGVLDTDGDFKHRFFRDKKLDIRKKSINGNYIISYYFGEYEMFCLGID